MLVKNDAGVENTGRQHWLRMQVENDAGVETAGETTGETAS
jgi:hypothetical protein